MCYINQLTLGLTGSFWLLIDQQFPKLNPGACFKQLRLQRDEAGYYHHFLTIQSFLESRICLGHNPLLLHLNQSKHSFIMFICSLPVQIFLHVPFYHNQMTTKTHPLNSQLHIGCFLGNCQSTRGCRAETL